MFFLTDDIIVPISGFIFSSPIGYIYLNLVQIYIV